MEKRHRGSALEEFIISLGSSCQIMKYSFLTTGRGPRELLETAVRKRPHKHN